tara:strand:+ start:36250 stop:36642 length:393 start_codon:yes stop_codon:yes gene_type:complete
MSGISPKLPLVTDRTDGSYQLNKTVQESIKQNLRSLMLTNPGEKVMDPEFGAGLQGFLFEPTADPAVRGIKNTIILQVKKYMPFIKVLDIDTSFGIPVLGESEQLLKVKVSFLIEPLNQTDILIINSNSN